MNNQTQQTATTLLQTTSEEELFQLFRQYGELADAGRIASLIVANRTDKPLATTDDLLMVIDPILPRQPQQRHRKLSRIYQSLRIAVNDELTALEEFLTSSIELLAPKGRLVVLTYHSLEDRLVKEAYRKASITAISPEERLLFGEKPGKIKLVGRKSIRPSQQELARNSRASSAQMRIAERIH